MLKLLRIALVLPILSPLITSPIAPAIAQERQGCFMVNAVGRLIDLSEICPSATQTVQTAATPQLGTGDIQATLRWATTDDLDLAVTDPSGDTATFSNPNVASGGKLDVDANAGCGSPTQTPIENIFWPPTQAPQGNYTVSVNLFARCQGTGPIAFTITLLVQGETQTLTGTVDDQNPIATFPFSLPQQSRSPQQRGSNE
ncbi:MAG TPA: hypothetical protein V6C57_21585 [Coleofasciculaceae cyanobacterium]